MDGICRASRIASVPPVTVVELHGEVDMDVVEPVRDCLMRQLEQDVDVVVDLTHVTLIDCVSLGALVEVRQLAERLGRQVCLAAPCAVVRRTLAATMLDTAFALYPDRRRAVGAVSAGLALQR